MKVSQLLLSVEHFLEIHSRRKCQTNGYPTFTESFTSANTVVLQHCVKRTLPTHFIHFFFFFCRIQARSRSWNARTHSFKVLPPVHLKPIHSSLNMNSASRVRVSSSDYSTTFALTAHRLLTQRGDYLFLTNQTRCRDSVMFFVLHRTEVWLLSEVCRANFILF